MRTSGVRLVRLAAEWGLRPTLSLADGGATLAGAESGRTITCLGDDNTLATLDDSDEH